MFFIGFFGTNAKAEASGQLDVGACPVCGGRHPLAVTRRYQYFHAFLIPLFKFHSEYFATCPGCASIFSVSDWCGKRAGEEGVFAVSPGELTLLRDNRASVCPNCGAPRDGDDVFCRRCGRRF